jgi:RNA polymerase sigma-70 factor (ECF subfamily)
MEPLDARISAFVAGDRSAGQALLLELLPRVRNVVRTLLGRDADVDDVAQQVMVEVIRSLSVYRGDGQLKSWVDRITVRVALAHGRRARVRRVVESQSFDDERAGVESVVGLQTLSAERYLEKRSAVRLLDQLPVAQKAAVVLHHVLGFTVLEIADQEQTSAETIRSRLRLGMDKLRRGTDEVPSPEESPNTLAVPEEVLR